MSKISHPFYKKKREETCISKLKLEQEEEHKNPLTRITTKSHKTFCTEFYYHPEKKTVCMQRKEWEK